MLWLVQKHVNLGFYNGSALNDTNSLLEGSGKKLRHIKVSKVSAITEDVVELIKLACEDLTG